MTVDELSVIVNRMVANGQGKYIVNTYEYDKLKTYDIYGDGINGELTLTFSNVPL